MDFSVSPKKLKLDRVPNNLQIIKAILYEKGKWMRENQNKKEPKISDMADILTQKVQEIYDRSGIKTVRKDKIKQKILEVYKYRNNCIKSPKRMRNSLSFSQKKIAYKSFMKQLLNVERKIEVEPIATKSKKQKSKKKATIESGLSECHSTYESDEISEIDDDPDFRPAVLPTTVPKYNKRHDLSEIAEVQSRYASSDRLTTAIVNATLRTFKISEVVDKSQLRRSHKRKTSDTAEVANSFGGGLYYDSRKDDSLTQTTKVDEHGNIRYYRDTVKESHYSLVSMPDGLFLEYVKPEGGTADKVSKTICTFMKDKNMFDGLIALGNDGENLNVGGDGGINHYIEVELGRPLHWFVCLLHTNELPLKNLINKLDGMTSSSNTFSGPVGKSLENVSLPVVKFKRFRHATQLPEIPDIVFKKLSNDQMYLYKIVNALISGIIPESLANLKIGRLNHSRWITTASRICRVFASTIKPSKTLKNLTAYVVNVYAPTWFQIKKNELAIDGPKNLFFLIEKCNQIEDEEVRAIVKTCIQRNAFFAHSENLILAQLSSKSRAERLNGVNRILEIRKYVPSSGIRRFTVPTLDFNARKWTRMIEFNDTVTEPPFTINMSAEELKNIVENPLIVPKFKCHTQMVERAVKEVTRVSSKLVSQDKRNSAIAATLINRAKYPKMDSKKDFSIQHKDTSKFVPKI